mgnify:CR=1 FL=1
MKRKIVILLLSILSTLSYKVYSQTSAIDSLKNVYTKETRIEPKIDALNELFTIEYSSNYENGLKYASQAFLISNKLDLGNRKNKKRLSQIHNNLGIAHLQLANYDESLKNLFLALDISESIQDTNKISDVINNIGVLYGYTGDNEKAYEYFIKSAEFEERTGNLKGAADSYSNLSLYYISDSAYVTGDYYYNKAMKIYKELGAESNVATLYMSRAMEMLNQKKYRKSLKYYNLAISINQSLNDHGSLATCYLNVSLLYSKIHKKKEAKTYGELALETANKLNSPDHMMTVYQHLSKLSEESGESKKSLNYFKKYIEWKDTIYNRESDIALAEMVAKYDFEKEEKEIKILKQDAAINLLEIENKSAELINSKILMYSAIGGGALLLLLAFTLYNRIKLKQKTNDTLRITNDDLLEAKEIIEEKNKDITASIEYAKYIQQSILPKKERIAESFTDSFLLLLPKDVVSGDFYWFQKFEDYSILVMADCTGHGVPGGFMSMMGAEMLNQVLSPSKIIEAGVALEEIDKRIRKNLNQVGSKKQQNDGMDIALCIFDFKNGKMQFSGANRPLIRVRGNELTKIKSNRFGVGGDDTIKKTFSTTHLDIKIGDSYYMYSDGYSDQFGGPKNKKFMSKRLNSLILEQSSLKMDEQEENFLQTFYDWKGSMQQIDDVCLIGVKV